MCPQLVSHKIIMIALYAKWYNKTHEFYKIFTLYFTTLSSVKQRFNKSRFKNFNFVKALPLI